MRAFYFCQQECRRKAASLIILIGWRKLWAGGAVEGGVDNVYGSPTYGTYLAEFSGSGGSIHQTVSTIAGDYYSLDFLAIQYQGTNYAAVYANNTSLLGTLNFTNMAGLVEYGGVANTNWESFSYTFQAASDMTPIQFIYFPQFLQMNGITDYGSGAVGDITLTVVPEPSIVALLGAGLAGGLAYSWRKRFNL